jgi:hypothetical protein
MYEFIEFIICYGEEVSPMAVKEKTRKREICTARQIIMYFCKMYKVGSLEKIGGYLGKDHATVLNSCKTINNLLDTDKSFRDKIAYYDSLISRFSSMNLKASHLNTVVRGMESRVTDLEQRCETLRGNVRVMELAS